jgi:hypothetical protein
MARRLFAVLLLQNEFDKKASRFQQQKIYEINTSIFNRYAGNFARIGSRIQNRS